MDGMVQAFTKLHHNAVGADVRVAAFSFALWSQHLRQIGAMDDIEAVMRTQFQQPMSAPMLAKLNDMGAQIPNGLYPAQRVALMDTEENRQYIRTKLANGGIMSLHNEIASELTRRSRDWHWEAALLLEHPHLMEPIQWGYCAIMGVAGLYMSTWALMGAMGYEFLALAIGGPAGALIGLAMAVAGMFCM